jgi:hypothetical protein
MVNASIADFGVRREEIRKIKANGNVQLSSHGAAKTDLVIAAETVSKGTVFTTFTIKESQSKNVSCHQYSAEAFIDVLNKANNMGRIHVDMRLVAEGLESFAKGGSWRSCKEGLQGGFEDYLRELHECMPVIASWALAGVIPGEDEKAECVARNIVLLDPVKRRFVIESVSEYIEQLSEKKKKNKGAPFSWTYKTKADKTKDIQLKVPLIYD